MKRLLIILTTLFCLLGIISCSPNANQNSGSGTMIVWKGSLEQAPESPENGWAYYNSKDKASYIFDGTEWQIMAKDGVDGVQDNSLKLLGNSKETIDGIEYNVKTYAYVYADMPYYFSYYKQYYLNEKLRRLYIFENEAGNFLDNDYRNFEEKISTNDPTVLMIDPHGLEEEWSPKKEMTFYEDGKLESYSIYSAENLSTLSRKSHYEYYAQSGNLKKYEFYDYQSGENENEEEDTIVLFSNVKNKILDRRDYDYIGAKAMLKYRKNSTGLFYYSWYESGRRKEYFTTEYDYTNREYLYHGNMITYSDDDSRTTLSEEVKTNAEIIALFESME